MSECEHGVMHTHRCDECDPPTTDDQRDGNAAIYVCPCCEVEQWVDVSFIPRELHYKLPQK